MFRLAVDLATRPLLPPPGDESINAKQRRDRIERVFIDYMVGPELPRRLSEIEARWVSSSPMAIDYRPRIAQLEK